MGGMGKLLKMRRVFVAFIVCSVCLISGATADIASAGYVREIVNALRVQPDWNQTDASASDYIKNKPDVPASDVVEYIANKVDVISPNAPETQYPSVRAVNDALSTKADSDDVRFNTISTTQPDGVPPAGQVFIWFN